MPSTQMRCMITANRRASATIEPSSKLIFQFDVVPTMVEVVLVAIAPAGAQDRFQRRAIT